MYFLKTILEVFFENNFGTRFQKGPYPENNNAKLFYECSHWFRLILKKFMNKLRVIIYIN